MSDERFLIPRSDSREHEAAMIAITARLRPIAESPIVRLVEVTYWRDGLDVPVVKAVYDTHTIGRWRQKAPVEATHLAIEERAWPTRAPWRFDVPEVPANVTAIKDSDGDVWLRAGDRWCLAGDAFDHTGSDIRDVLPHGPLVECEDPRAAS